MSKKLICLGIAIILILVLIGCVQEKIDIPDLEKDIEDNKTNNEPNTTFLEKIEELSIKSYETRPDGAVRITNNLLSAQNGAFSQDSKKIVFTHFKSSYNKGEADLKILDLETGEVKLLIGDGNSNVNLPGSSWIGDEIIFSSTKAPHDEIYVIDTISKETKQITSREDLVAYEASFSPAKKRIVFESHKLDVEEEGIITIYNIKEETYTEITHKDEDSRQPNWSPRGDLILYQKLVNNQWDIWIYNLTSGKESKISYGNGDKTDAAFSSNSEWIVYSSNEGGEEIANIYVQSTDGIQRVKVTNYNGYDGAPSWSYDNKYILFESTIGEPDDSEGSSLWIIPFQNLS